MKVKFNLKASDIKTSEDVSKYVLGIVKLIKNYDEDFDLSYSEAAEMFDSNIFTNYAPLHHVIQYDIFGFELTLEKIDASESNHDGEPMNNIYKITDPSGSIEFMITSVYSSWSDPYYHNESISLFDYYIKQVKVYTPK
ncbi:MAG: hypothetical protein JHC31_02665 [Sulfurihydrogenibium sp.]|jgi:hypothetical protein|nr:hypothetical protein [Sulfurihydrogenibium sp.]